MIGLTLDVFRKPAAARGASVFTVMMFMFVFYLTPVGSAVASQSHKEDERSRKIEQALENTPEKKLAHRLEKLQQKLAKELPASASKRQQDQTWLQRMLERLGLGGSPLSSDEISEVTMLAEEVRKAYREAIGIMEEEGRAAPQNRKLSGSAKSLVKERHAVAINEITKKYSAIDAKLVSFTTTKSADEQSQLLNELSDALSKEKFKRSHSYVDPDNMPWGFPEDSVRKPKMTKGDIRLALEIDQFEGYAQLASTTLTPEMLNPMGLPSDADLAETIDAVISEEIKALAESLNNNPVEIYTWVHNNIRYIPSYGSIQGAQYTLETGKGNAVDTASLLIALLRAAGIPARYAYGTVEVPVNKVMNWVGGVSEPEAAQSLLGQGGVPNVALVRGGTIKSIRMEHVWVEAYVDFEPSRGVKNREGDRWIPMDASFKQYEFTEGMNLSEQVPFDAEGLANQIEQSATINDEQGWVQNIPQSDVESSLQQFQSQLEDYINNQNPEATVGEVLGLRELRILPPRPLAAGLPYGHVVTQQSFSEVPDSLRHKFKYELATQSFGYPNAAFIAINEPTVKLAGKKLALSFHPATEDDQAIIESYIPEPDPETRENDPDSIPNALPGYLIHLVADFTLDGEVVQSGGNQTMGTELYETLGLYSPSHGWGVSNNHPIAGEYRAVGLDLQGISAAQAGNLQASIESTKQKLESSDTSQLATLTKHDVIGDLIYATIMSYFALNDVQEEIQAQSANMVTYRLPSYGIFSTSLQPQYWFGIPRNTSFSGLTMDVDRVMFHGAAKDNSKETRIHFTQANGARLSAMEHLVPEQMFSTADAPAHGISAVKALAIAAAEGQKIWTITQNNLELALSSISLSPEVESEIRNSVLAGKIATAHETQLSYFGWVGSGYLLIDPETGAGAYKISGGSNGGHTEINKDAPENLLNFLLGVMLESVSQLGEATDKFAVKIFGWFNTAVDFFKIGKSCWNQFELLVVAVMVFSVLFFAAAFGSIVVGLISIIWLRIVLLALMSFGAGLAVDGIRREYCGE